MQQYLLSFLIFTPLLAAFLILFIPTSFKGSAKTITLIASLFQCFFLILIIIQYDANHGLQLVEQKPWITLDLGSWGILKAEYFVALDGLNLPLICLSTGIMLIAI